jgi:hypothetical protein
LRAGGNFYGGTDGGDFAVFDDEGAIVNGRACERDDFGVSDSEDGCSLLRGGVYGQQDTKCCGC